MDWTQLILTGLTDYGAWTLGAATLVSTAGLPLPATLLLDLSLPLRADSAGAAGERTGGQPDDSFLLAITTAAQRGVEVTLVNSKAVDQFFTYHAQRSY